MDKNFKLLKSNKLFINILIILSFILLAFISAILLLKNNAAYVGFDTQFHFKRILEIEESIKHGQLFPNFSFNEFHGSAVMTFYPYLNLMPAVLLTFIIKSKIHLIFGIFILHILLNFIISFYSARNYTKSYLTSYTFSIIYSLLSVFLNYHFLTSDFGIVLSYIFLPLAIFGFIKTIQGRNGWIQLSVGVSLLLYSHILNFIIIIGFLIIYFLINVRKFNKSIISNLIKSFLLFILLTVIIWLPFLVLYFNNFNNFNMPNAFPLSKISIKDFMSGLYGSKNRATIGFFPIISIFITPFFYKEFNRYIKQMYLMSLIMVLGVLFLPWTIITSNGIFKLLEQFQYTARFLIIPQMTLSFIFALIVSQYIYSIKQKTVICFLTIFISIFMQLLGQYTMINKLSNNPSVENYVQNKGNSIQEVTNILNYRIYDSSQFNLLLNIHFPSDNDYIPKNAVSNVFHVNKNLGIYNNYNKIKVKHTGYNTFRFTGKSNINKLSLPIYAYNKERLNIYLNDEPVKYYANKDGLLTIYNINSQVKTNNKIYIQEKTSRLKITGIVLSILGWLFALYVLVKRKIKH